MASFSLRLSRDICFPQFEPPFPEIPIRVDIFKPIEMHSYLRRRIAFRSDISSSWSRQRFKLRVGPGELEEEEPSLYRVALLSPPLIFE